MNNSKILNRFHKTKIILLICAFTGLSQTTNLFPTGVDKPMPVGKTSPQVKAKLKPEHQQKEVSRGGEHEIDGFKVIKKLENYKMTFYSLDRRCVGSDSEGIGKSGRRVKPFKSVAVDPSHIPLDTYLYIPGYGVVRCDDTGSKVKGRRIDLFTNWSYGKMMDEGIKEVDILVLERKGDVNWEK